MNRYVLVGFMAVTLFWAGSAAAKEVHLGIGETFSQGDLTITCGQSSPDMPLTLNECQYWDDFNKSCLFEKTTYTSKNVECVAECQHWDSFYHTCHYQTTCTFFPDQNTFLRTTCEKFDPFSKSCLKMKQTRIGL